MAAGGGATGESLEPLAELDFSFVLTDPRQAENPICFASAGFYEMTGYDAPEVIGRSGQFLQDSESECRKVTELRDAIKEEKPCQACILSYKKGGEAFWDQMYLNPVKDESGTTTYYIEVHTDVTDVLTRANGGKPVDDGASPKGASILPAGLLQALSDIQQSLVLVDPREPDMPIVHASGGFLQLTGYPVDKVVGYNCRFLQGMDTDPKVVAKVRAAVAAQPAEPVTATLLNYRYDGTPFWNYLHISPIRGVDGSVAYLAGVQVDVTEGDDGGAPLQATVSLKHKLLHSCTIGKVKVAVRSLGGGERGVRQSMEKFELTRRASIGRS